MDGDPSEAPAVGYFKLFGVSGDLERAKEIVFGSIQLGEIDWNDTEWYEVDPRDLDKDVLAAIKPINGVGIWYESGRGFFPADAPQPSRNIAKTEEAEQAGTCDAEEAV
jgi:hypothetical protein